MHWRPESVPHPLRKLTVLPRIPVFGEEEGRRERKEREGRKVEMSWKRKEYGREGPYQIWKQIMRIIMITIIIKFI